MSVRVRNHASVNTEAPLTGSGHTRHLAVAVADRAPAATLSGAVLSVSDPRVQAISEAVRGEVPAGRTWSADGTRGAFEPHTVAATGGVRFGAGTRADAGDFTPATTAQQFRAVVDRTVDDGVWIPRTGGDYEIVAQFADPIGRDSAGKPTRWLTAVVDNSGALSGAAPSRRRGPDLGAYVATHGQIALDAATKAAALVGFTRPVARPTASAQSL